MAFPVLLPFTTTPNRNNPTTFSADTDQYHLELTPFVPNLNLWATEANTLGDEIFNARDTTVNAKDIALSTVNYKGDYVSGTYNLNESVTYTDGFNYVSKINGNTDIPTTSNWYRVPNIDDSATTDYQMWSSEKINTELDNLETTINSEITKNSTFTFSKKDNNIPIFEKITPHSFNILKESIVFVADKTFKLNNDYLLDIDTNLDTGSKVAGTDYYVYIIDNGTFIISANATAPSGYTILNTRKIGGFHYGLIPENLAPINNITQIDADNIAGINAFSFWDLKWMPINGKTEGMVCVGSYWVDIYLCNNDHIINGTSKAGVSIAGGALTNNRQYPKIPLSKGGDGTLTYDSMTWFEASEIGQSYGKRLLSYEEFTHIAFGVKEASSADTLDDGTTKHLVDYLSKFGIEQATGVQYTWGSDLSNGYGTTTFAWKANTEGRGSIYSTSNSPTAVVLGGHRASTTNSGSRCSNLDHYIWVSYWSAGVRFACDHAKIN